VELAVLAELVAVVVAPRAEQRVAERVRPRLQLVDGLGGGRSEIDFVLADAREALAEFGESGSP
jgi:hypothetical protein